MTRPLFVVSFVVFLALLLMGGCGCWIAATDRAPVTAELRDWPGVAAVGDPVRAEFSLRCPWGVAPGRISVTPSPEWVVYGEPEVKRNGIPRWGYLDYQVTVTLRPVEPHQADSDGAAARVRMEFPRIWGAALPAWSGVIPDANVPYPDMAAVKPELTLMGPIDAEAEATLKWYVYLIIGLAAAFALVSVFCLIRLRKRRPAAVVPPWELAALRLCQLRSEIAGSHDLGGCLARLTDIVRGYLEERFRLAATRQTTTEFLASLRKNDSPLPSEHRDGLAEFMTAADLVKFAGQSATPELLSGALDEAERLVRDTVPAPEEGK